MLDPVTPDLRPTASVSARIQIEHCAEGNRTRETRPRSRNPMDELDLLRDMTPSDEPELPLTGHGRRLPALMIVQAGMVLLGLLFTLVCGFRLFVFVGQSMLF